MAAEQGRDPEPGAALHGLVDHRPPLTAELIALSTLVGLAATRMRAVTMASALLMIFTGHLGGVVIDDGRGLAALWTWNSSAVPSCS